MQQNTKEWLDFRKDKIGASDAPIIVGVSPWSTPFQLWEEKLGLREPRPMTAAMQDGKDNEAMILRFYNAAMGVDLQPKVLQHLKWPWMMASLDGYSDEHMVEIKYAGKEDHARAQQGEVPAKYIPQLQHQLCVAGMDWMHYVSSPRNGEMRDTKILKVYRDDEFLDELIALETEFFNMMQNFCPPEMGDKDCSERSDAEWMQLAYDLTKAKLELADQEAKFEELRKRAIDLAAGQSVIGGGIRLTKTHRKGNVDYKAIPELRGVDLELYRGKPSSIWRLTT